MSDGWYFYSWFKGAGLDMHVNEDGVTNSCNWNATDTPITGVQVVEALLAVASNPGFKEADSDPFVAGVKDGSIIAGVSGTWNANVAAEAWGENYAATKLPTYTVNGEQVQMSSFAGFKLVGVNPYSENVGAAMDFAAFMTNEQSQMSRFELRSEGPSNVTAAASEVVQKNPRSPRWPLRLPTLTCSVLATSLGYCGCSGQDHRQRQPRWHRSPDPAG